MSSVISSRLDDQTLASQYEQASRERQFLAGQARLAELRIGPGERVLDVGSGTGRLAEHVASVVGDAGRVVGIDPLALRIEIDVQERPHVQYQPPAEAAIDFAQASSFGNFLGHLRPELAAQARAEIAAELRPLETSASLRQESVRLVAVAREAGPLAHSDSRSGAGSKRRNG